MLFFQLFNDSGLSNARSLISCSPTFPWQEVGKKPSYADAVQMAPLSGANKVPIGARSSSSQGPNQHKQDKFLANPNGARKSVFQRVQFPQQLPQRGPPKSSWRPKRVLSSVDQSRSVHPIHSSVLHSADASQN